jgi:Protein of unknown function (DUF2442)
MSFSAIEFQVAPARNVLISDEALTLELTDGRTLSVPLTWYPRLWHGQIRERNQWRLIGGAYFPLVAATISSEFPRPAGWPWELGPSNAVTPVSSSGRQAPCRNALGTRPGHATSRVGPKVATATSPPLRLPDCQRPRFRHQVFATSRRSARGRSTQIPLALI